MVEKQKDVQSSQLNLAVVALVALVAIVGLVALVMNAARIPGLATGSKLVGAQATAEPSGNLGGQASATGIRCYYTTECTSTGYGYNGSLNGSSGNGTVCKRVRYCDESSGVLYKTE